MCIDGPDKLVGEPPSSTSRQLALSAFGVLAQHCSAGAPAALLLAIPSVLAATLDPKRAVRASALAATAAAMAALGSRAVPVLPKVAPAVIAAASAALEGLSVGDSQVRHVLL